MKVNNGQFMYIMSTNWWLHCNKYIFYNYILG